MTNDRKKRVRWIRDRKHWLRLGLVVILLPAFVVVGLEMFPGADPKALFLAGAGSGLLLAEVVHAWVMRGGHPKCPNCGGTLEIVETKYSSNAHHFERGGRCPRCGTPL